LLLLKPQGGVQSSPSQSCDAANTSWDGGVVKDLTRKKMTTTLFCPDIFHIGRELGYGIDVVEVPRRAFGLLLLESVGDWAYGQ
jgi:hypothetical protein